MKRSLTIATLIILGVALVIAAAGWAAREAKSTPPIVAINPSSPKPAPHSAYDFANFAIARGNSTMANDARSRYKISAKSYGLVDVFASTKTLGIHKFLYVVLRNNTRGKYAVEVDISAVPSHGKTWFLDLRAAYPDGTKPAGYSDVILNALLNNPKHSVQISGLDFAQPQDWPALKYVDVTVHVHPVGKPHDVTNAMTRVGW